MVNSNNICVTVDELTTALALWTHFKQLKNRTKKKSLQFEPINKSSKL